MLGNFSPSNQYKEKALAKRAALDIKATTINGDRKIHWISKDSQGSIAQEPPTPPPRHKSSNNATAIPELKQHGAQRGPPGTVPIALSNLDYLDHPGSRKQAPNSTTFESKRQYSGDHWYSSSTQYVSNLGGSADFSLFSPYVANTNDFSLLQTLVGRTTDVPKWHTLEAGWINYPIQIAEAHLFTYFTTCQYTCYGDYLGGYNTDVKGWVQTSDTIFPGTVFTPSVDGGTQYELEILTYLYQDNWWVWVQDGYIGYYPASIWSNANNGANGTLADGADSIFYYGEVYQSEDALTTTDMGNGEFGASNGFGKAAYIHNMQYFDTNSVAQDYTAGFWDSDDSRYNFQNTVSSGGSWGSYVYLGGPGAEGIVGG
ncbi:uncharacterized protein LY89DRAFT_769335 [Mollisia scopiformis]|uniref:Neprosin PEP catalytic domain-containing protein n=1 Tax=Mollisia scopiformis TaxID=149040 RepID=A0A132B2H7_MOLSC|nr:uncharacterized protein LY89DRAFT_769335 [Mollisia scopiformis]KUJ06453.1 hypothetical protein LY89DRAFT_769335 [Mollisia scopiformis]